MFLKTDDEQTISALSTAPGTGGIAVIRVSGSEALSIGRKLCRFLPEKPESHRAYFGICRDAETGEQLDEVLVTYFEQGRSFTGDETIEISCHGSQVLTATILKSLIQAGSRLARRGEFTYRAFMNGKLDLVQAESVLSLIESQTRESAKVALRQLQGELSDDFQSIESALTGILAHLEASIDFSTEGLETIEPTRLAAQTEQLSKKVDRLIGSYSKGRILREGLQIALIGRPNAGKSSLLNALVREERAIVTSIAGTTRDLIEGRVTIEGIPVTYVDTAGLRETENEIEKIGIERSRSAMSRSDLLFYVVDLTQSNWFEDVADQLDDANPNTYLVFNKADLDSTGELKKSVMKTLENTKVFGRVFWISALKSDGLDEIEEMIRSRIQALGSENSNVVTQARHLELLSIVRSSLQTAHRLMSAESSPEFIAFELQGAIRAVHELLGKEFDEQVIDRIFKEFCLGK